MKKGLIPILIVLGSLLFSCQKCKELDDVDYQEVKGTWDWHRTEDHSGQFVLYEYPTSEKFVSFNFSSDKKYTVNSNGSQIFSGTVTILTLTSQILSVAVCNEEGTSSMEFNLAAPDTVYSYTNANFLDGQSVVQKVSYYAKSQ